MIHIFYGEDRLAAEKKAKALLGPNCEIIDAENLEKNDLPTIFLGTSLFESERKILIKGIAEKSELFNEVEKYLETSHEIVILEDKISGNLTSFKNLKKSKNIDIKEFKKAESFDPYLAFNIYSTALNNPKKALEMLRDAEKTSDAYMMVGAWATKALKTKNKNAIKELAKIDVLLKTTKFSETPWTLLETYVLKLQKL